MKNSNNNIDFGGWGGMEGLAKAALVLMLSDVLCAHMNIVFQNVCPNVTFTSLICHPLLTFFFCRDFVHLFLSKIVGPFSLKRKDEKGFPLKVVWMAVIMHNI